MLEKIRSVFSRPFEKFFYHLGGVFNRNNAIWAFGAQKRSFSCNPKYLFLHVSEHATEYGTTPVWLTKDRRLAANLREQGLRAYSIRSPRGLYYGLRAGLYFINCDIHDISFTLSKNAHIVNLWHGIPLKKIQFDNTMNARNVERLERREENSRFDRLFNPRDLVSYDYVLSATEWVAKEAFQSAFRIRSEQCLTAGYPRTDLFYQHKSDIKNFVLRYEHSASAEAIKWCESRNRVFVYMPTWRDNKADFITASGINFQELDEILTAQGDGMLVKMHPYTRIDANVFKGLNAIQVVDKRSDIYPILPFTDTLITDYSSIYFDYLCLERPVIFFCFDLDEYLSDCREMYFDYASITPGPKATSYAELRALIEQDDWPSQYREQVRTLKEKVWNHYDGNCSATVVRFIQQRYMKGTPVSAPPYSS